MPPPPDTIMFFSNAKKPLHVLSNLYRSPMRDIEVTWPEQGLECVPAFLRGKACVYPTREHAYQSLRAVDLQTAESLMAGGRLAHWRAFERWPSGKDIRERMEKKWGPKGMMGIVAKLAVSAKGWEGIAFRPRENLDDESVIAVWHLIHAAFFVEGASETEVLRETAGKRLAEFSARARADTYYACKYELCGKRVGRNRMGLMLQAFRDSLPPPPQAGAPPPQAGAPALPLL